VSIETLKILIKSNLKSSIDARKLDTVSEMLNYSYNNFFDKAGLSMLDFAKMFLTNQDFKNAVISTAYQNKNKESTIKNSP